MEKKEDFYHELDTKGRRSFCTCQTLLIGLVILAIGLVVAATWAVKKITTKVGPTREVVATRSDAVNLQQKVADLSKAPGASTNLRITEQELTTLLVEAVSQSTALPLRGVQAEINPTEVVITGTATKYITSTLSISVIPKVVDGKPKLELVKIQAGNLAVPSALTDLLANGLDDLLTKQLTNVSHITLKSIILAPGYMTLSGMIRPSPASSPS